MTLNKDEAQRTNNELHRDAKKQQILEALKEGPAFPDALAKRLGGRSDQAFVRLLHEMLDDMEITFNWIRGYSV